MNVRIVKRNPGGQGKAERLTSLLNTCAAPILTLEHCQGDGVCEEKLVFHELMCELSNYGNATISLQDIGKLVDCMEKFKHYSMKDKGNTLCIEIFLTDKSKIRTHLSF